MHFLSTECKHEENLPAEGRDPCRLPYRLFITVRRVTLIFSQVFELSAVSKTGLFHTATLNCACSHLINSFCKEIISFLDSYLLISAHSSDLIYASTSFAWSKRYMWIRHFKRRHFSLIHCVPYTRQIWPLRLRLKLGLWMKVRIQESMGWSPLHYIILGAQKS